MQALSSEAEVLRDSLNSRAEDVLPQVIDRTSRMQELINDILASMSSAPLDNQVTGAAAF